MAPFGSLDRERFERMQEAAIAGARLGCKEIESESRELFARDSGHLEFDLDTKAALIGALVLFDGAGGYLDWLERLLGNRGNPARISWALRAVEAAQVRQAREWVRPLVFTDKNDLIDTEVRIEEHTRAAMRMLGKPDLPANEDELNRFGRSSKSSSALAEAFSMLRSYLGYSLCERAREPDSIEPEPLDCITRWLGEQLRFSAVPPGARGG